jgi:5-methylcytosine-specific restriction endonuclease McrA
MHLEADLEIPDALALREAVASGAEHLAKLGSTDTVDGRRATALGDLARRQLTLGFDPDGPHDTDDPDDTDRTYGAVGEDGGLVDGVRAAKPVTQIVIYAHLSADAITGHDGSVGGAAEALCARVEQAGQQLLSVEQIRQWCGRPDAAVTVKPVIDLRERLETKGYAPTAAMREHVIVRDGTCVFPWCGRNARLGDLDHVVPYDHDHPDRGGQTSTDNLAALCRRHHRLKTKGRWRYRMTAPGVFEWTSPLGWTYRRDHTGSRCTGRAWPEAGSGSGTDGGDQQHGQPDRPDLRPPDR